MGLLVYNKMVPNNMSLIPALRFCKCCILVNYKKKQKVKIHNENGWYMHTGNLKWISVSNKFGGNAILSYLNDIILDCFLVNLVETIYYSLNNWCRIKTKCT